MRSVLSRGLSGCQFNGTSHCPAMKPTIGIDPNGFAFELSKITWLMDGFKQRQEPYTVSIDVNGSLGQLRLTTNAHIGEQCKWTEHKQFLTTGHTVTYT